METKGEVTTVKRGPENGSFSASNRVPSVSSAKELLGTDMPAAAPLPQLHG
jgi:hypothetical protein